MSASAMQTPAASSLVGTQPPLAAREFAALRREAIFHAGKWDPQVGDHEALAAFPLCLDAATWRQLALDAEALAREALEAEAELLARSDLFRLLGLPRAVRRRLAEVERLGPARGVARVLRFDFHPTTEGWRISEANSDVPGGFIEASPISTLMAARYPGWEPAGDPVSALADAVAAAAGPGGRVALVHATAYVDDHQVMACLARAFAQRGLAPSLVSPTRLAWEGGRASLVEGSERRPVDLVVRFFPAEWLPGAATSTGWAHFFRGSLTPLCNPAHALLTQGKRFPLAFERLRTPLPTWRRLLPETRDPREAPWRNDPTWVLKPTWGRVGEAIGLVGVTPEKEQRRIARSARWFPRSWVAQRRFTSQALEVGGEPRHVCIGVYTVDGRAAGAYGRVARRPLIDGEAQDAAVLVPTATVSAARCAAARTEELA